MKLSFIVVLFASACSVSEHTSVSARTEFDISDPFFSGRAVLKPITKGFKIILLNSASEQLDQAVFNYKSYHLDTADVDRDGRTGILVGLIKPTEFDPSEKKRLFILRIDDGQLRPLWLGSKVCQQLIDFKTLPNGVVETLEKTKNGNYAIGTYAWQGFGLALIDYIHNEKPYQEAVDLFGS